MGQTKRMTLLREPADCCGGVLGVSDQRAGATIEVYRQVVPGVGQSLNVLKNLENDPHVAP